jgi:hypothetical protein
MLALPVPEHGGLHRALLPFLNLSSRNDFVLVVGSGPFRTPLPSAQKWISLYVVQELQRVPYQRPKLSSFFNRCFPIQTVLDRVLIASRRAGSRRATMHPTTLLAVHRRRHAGLA